MPPPSSEDDLKRHARRRLIGAVALTLLAVVVLPLLLEDGPPPASSLAVRMPPAPAPVLAAQPDEVDAVGTAPPAPAPEAKPAPRPEAPAPTVSRPVPQAASPRPVAQRAPRPVPQAKPAAAGEAFVVQLAALSDAARAKSLKARAVDAGLPAYIDTVGTLTRVRVGPYPSREAAGAAVKKLGENGIKDVKVLVQ